MRSKRMLTLLLVVCLVLSCIAPAAAIRAGEGAAAVNVSDAQQSSLPTTQTDNKLTVSKQDNSMVISGEGTASSVGTLKGQADASAEETVQTIQPGEDQAAGSETDAPVGTWEVTPTDKAGTVADAQLPASVLELREAAASYVRHPEGCRFI